MENMHARKALALAVVSVLSLGLAACSSGGGARPDNPVDWFKQLFSRREEAIPERG